MVKKKRAIVTGGSGDQFPAMAITIQNLFDLNPDITDEFVVFHDGNVSKKDMDLLSAKCPVRYLQYAPPFNQTGTFDRTIWHYFTVMLFCKYECFRLLSEYESVLWTDYDVFVLQDISELFTRTQFSAYFIKEKSPIKKFNEQLYSHLDYFRDYDLINGISICTPIFILHDNFPQYMKFYQECIQNTEAWAECLSCGEEGVISLLLQKHHVDVGQIERDVFCLHVRQQPTDDTKIVHAYWQPKFWNGLHYRPWERYYRKWLKQGGSRIPNDHYMLKAFVRDWLPYKLVNYLLKKRNG